VGDSLLVQDHKFDCVLLFYRCTELARAGTPRDAVLLALGTRFAGGDHRTSCMPTVPSTTTTPASRLFGGLRRGPASGAAT
jgi:hypothetical protein